MKRYFYNLLFSDIFRTTFSGQWAYLTDVSIWPDTSSEESLHLALRVTLSQLKASADNYLAYYKEDPEKEIEDDGSGYSQMLTYWSQHEDNAGFISKRAGIMIDFVESIQL